MKKHKTAKECALFLLEYRDRTEKEMRQKLKEREYTQEEIDQVLVFLKEYRFINDAEYTRRYIRVNSTKKSTRQIRVELEKKGIGKELLSLCLEEAPVDEEEQIRKLLVKKGYVPGEKMEPDAYRKVMGALCRKGFDYDTIRRVTARMCQEDLPEL